MKKLMEHPAVRVALVLLATLRATRFITQDWLGEWTIGVHAKRWANRHEALVDDDVRFADAHGQATILGQMPVEHENGWRSKLVKGLDCPYCVGFWLGALVVLAELLTGPKAPLRALRPLWTFVAGVAGLNYVVGNVSSRIDG